MQLIELSNGDTYLTTELFVNFPIPTNCYFLSPSTTSHFSGKDNEL